MFKKTRKKLSVIVVLAMVMTLLAGFAAPAAAAATTGAIVGSVPTFPEAGAADKTLASVRYAESSSTVGNIENGLEIEIELPDGVTRDDDPAFDISVGDTILDPEVAGYIEIDGTAIIDVEVLAVAADSWKLKLTRGTLLEQASFVLKFPVDVGAGSGDIEVTITTSSDNVEGGDFVLGRWGTAKVTVSAVGTTIPKLSMYDGGGQSIRNIRFKENLANAFAATAANEVVLTLPTGMTWGSGSATYAIGADTLSAVKSGRKLTLTRDAVTSTAAATVTLDWDVVVTRLASAGDVEVTVIGKGANNNINTSLIVGTVSDYSVTVARKDGVSAKNVTAGRANQAVANFEIKEGVAGSLIPTGTITLTLPAGFSFVEDSGSPGYATIQTSHGDATLDLTDAKLESDGRVAKITVNDASSSKATITVSNIKVNVSPKASGEVEITVAGSAGAGGTVVVGNVVQVATVSASSVNSLRRGLDGQAAGDIVITEADKGKLTEGKIILTLPANVTFNKKPTVTRTSGNLSLGDVTMNSAKDTVEIQVNSRSTSASTITISDISYNVSSAIADGEIKVRILGNALVDDEISNTATTGNLAEFNNNDHRIRVANARVGAATKSVFTIGALTFTQDGQTLTMDVAPVIKNGRTLLPLRYAAMAAGVSPDEILWDPVRKAVTLIRGDRVVQLTIGSTTMLINGAAVTMDVAAEIIDGRTMLPIRWIAIALRANVDWDATAKTVTVIPY